MSLIVIMYKNTLAYLKNLQRKATDLKPKKTSQTYGGRIFRNPAPIVWDSLLNKLGRTKKF